MEFGSFGVKRRPLAGRKFQLALARCRVPAAAPPRLDPASLAESIPARKLGLPLLETCAGVGTVVLLAAVFFKAPVPLSRWQFLRRFIFFILFLFLCFSVF
jgi:hypothetical protein